MMCISRDLNQASEMRFFGTDEMHFVRASEMRFFGTDERHGGRLGSCNLRRCHLGHSRRGGLRRRYLLVYLCLRVGLGLCLGQQAHPQRAAVAHAYARGRGRRPKMAICSSTTRDPRGPRPHPHPHPYSSTTRDPRGPQCAGPTPLGHCTGRATPLHARRARAPARSLGEHPVNLPVLERAVLVAVHGREEAVDVLSPHVGVAEDGQDLVQFGRPHLAVTQQIALSVDGTLTK